MHVLCIDTIQISEDHIDLCLAGFDEHLKDRYRNAVRRVQPANVQEVTADAMQNLSR